MKLNFFFSDFKVTEEEVKFQLSSAYRLYYRSGDRFSNRNIFLYDVLFDSASIKLAAQYETTYAVNRYLQKIKTKKFVRDDKPVDFFEDREYNEFEKVLLEQARYYELPPDQSNAQQQLGGVRGLEYVGLQFPYGSELKNDT